MHLTIRICMPTGTILSGIHFKGKNILLKIVHILKTNYIEVEQIKNIT